MNDNYVEFMVKKKTPVWQTCVVWLLLAISAIGAVFYIILPINIIPIIVAVVAGVGFYFLRLNFDLEYEYLYVDKEMTIDKIMGKSKRKTVRKIDMDRVEMVAPEKSWHLGDYKNRQLKVEDFTSGEAKERYVMITDSSKVLIEVNDELIKLFKNTIPRKIFTD